MMLDKVLNGTQDEASRAFVRNWFKLRGERQMPDRRDVDPTAVAALLPKVWMWDFVPERQDFACRLVGEEILTVFGRNPRGTLLGDWVPKPVVDVARPRYRRVIDEPAICIASGRSYVSGDKHAWCERVITPLTNGKAAPIVFGISVWRMTELSVGLIEREDTEAAFYPLA